MKRLGVLASLLTVFIGFTFTSCLDSEDDGIRTTSAIVRVKGTFYGTSYFEDLSGYQLYPTASALASMESTYDFDVYNTNVAWSYFEYNVEDYDTEKEGMDIDLKIAVSLEEYSNVRMLSAPGTEDDPESTGPIIGLSKTVSTDNELFLIDGRFLLTGVNYYLASDENIGYTTLVWYTSEITADSEELKLYLRFDDNNATQSSYTSEAYYAYYPDFFYRAFDLGSALAHYQDVTERSSVTINVEVEVSSEINATTSTLKNYKLEYKFDSAD